jgi:hypothetical protein
MAITMGLIIFDEDPVGETPLIIVKCLRDVKPRESCELLGKKGLDAAI